MATNIGRSLAGAVALAASIAFAPTAQAAFYSSTYDPLGLTVNAIYEINDSCLTGSNTWVSANFGGPCRASLRSAVATVEELDPNSLYFHQSILIPFVTYDANPVGISNIIFRVYDAGIDNPAGIRWFPNFIGPQITGGYPLASNFNGTWGLSFFDSDLSGPPFDTMAYLFKQKCETTRRGTDCDWKLVDSAPPDPSFLIAHPSGLAFEGDERPSLNPDGSVRAAFVPEPSSIALLLGALGAGWITRRRKAIA